MTLNQEHEAVRAAVAVATSLGVPADKPTIVDIGEYAMISLSDGAVVAKVAWLSDIVRPNEHDIMSRDVEFSTWLADRDGSSARTYGPPTVHSQDSFVISLWNGAHLAAGKASTLPSATLGASLARLHRSIADYSEQLPGANWMANDVWEVIDLMSDRIGNSRSALADLSGTITVCVSELDRTTNGRLDGSLPGKAQILHGRPCATSAGADDKGVVYWSDFGTAWRGPVEFDVASLCDGKYTGKRAQQIIAGYYEAGGAELDPGIFALSTKLADALDICWALVRGTQSETVWQSAIQRLHEWQQTGL